MSEKLIITFDQYTKIVEKFIEKELDANAITNRKTYLETEFKKPWAQRAGLPFFKKKNT